MSEKYKYLVSKIFLIVSQNFNPKGKGFNVLSPS